MFDILLEDPRDTPWNKWGCGVAFPVLIIGWGLRVMYLPTVSLGLGFLGRTGRRHLELSGSDPWWFGLALLGAACLAHFHFFWTNHPPLAAFAELGKVVSLIILIVGFAAILVSHSRII
jgi:hypothetical protein